MSNALLRVPPSAIPIAVNFHFWKPCNLKCRFCFAVFADVLGRLSVDDARRLVGLLAEAGCEKLTFVGGEPTLCPYLGELLADAHAAKMITCVVSNGARLQPLIERQAHDIDWIGLSVDSGCRGSPNQTAIDRAVDALARRGWRRVVVVGGSPGTREELGELVGDRIELRLVSGTERRTSRDAKADLAWADVVVVWGSTELDHTVSKHYKDARDGRVVTCPKRGIAAVASTIIEAAAVARYGTPSPPT